MKAPDKPGSRILVSEHHKRKLAMARAGEYKPTFSTKLLSKDMGLLLADARACGAPIPAMAVVSQLYAAAAQSHPDEDYASAIGFWQHLTQATGSE